ncbi:hypothetical protein ACWDUX_29805 [Streptomyces sp. NPDC003444]
MTLEDEPKLTPAEEFFMTTEGLADAFWKRTDALIEVAEVAMPEVNKLDSRYLPSTFNAFFDRLTKAELKKTGRSI